MTTNAELFICVDFARAELLLVAAALSDHQQPCTICREVPPTIADKKQEPVVRTKQKFPRAPKFLKKGSRR